MIFGRKGPILCKITKKSPTFVYSRFSIVIFVIMKLNKILSLIVVWAFALTARADWRPDILGDGYEMRYVDQGSDYDGSVRSTIIRKVAQTDGRFGVLYIHGFNDYFFQKEMADEFVGHGYDFYAVDLRRYGRSLMAGQTPFKARNIDEYYPDIDSALVEMRRDGVDHVVLMGHSTGGLIAACYVNDTYPAGVDALILNSPFLDWNLGRKEWLIPLVSFWGRWFPNTKIPQGASRAYAESLLAGYHGEWSYNTSWKLEQSPDVTAGWVRAITLAQKSLRSGKADIRIPILLMYSAKSISGSEWSPEHNDGDGVLDVNDIMKYGRGLGPDVTSLKVVGGLHDLMLSRPGVRNPLYRYIFNWLDQSLPIESTGTDLAA